MISSVTQLSPKITKQQNLVWTLSDQPVGLRIMLTWWHKVEAPHAENLEGITHVVC